MQNPDEPPSTLTLAENGCFCGSIPTVSGESRRYLAVGPHRLYPFTIDTGPILKGFLKCNEVPLSDYSFANNIIWLSLKSGFYQIIDQCFCLFSLNGDCLTMLLPPLGSAKNQAQALDSCFAVMDSYNPSPFLGTVEYVYRDFLQVIEPCLEGEADSATGWLVEPSLPDYIYRTDDLIHLRGNAYKSKRSEINQFTRLYPGHHIEPLGCGHWQGVRELMDTWLINRIKYLPAGAVAESLRSAEQERQAVERAIQYYDRLGLDGLGLVIGDRLEGFVLGERISPSVASVLVEKTNFAVAGAAQYLFRETARLFADCEYMNVGDDLGMEGLRRVKMSYRPALFGEKVTLRRAT